MDNIDEKYQKLLTEMSQGDGGSIVVHGRWNKYVEIRMTCGNPIIGSVNVIADITTLLSIEETEKLIERLTIAKEWLKKEQAKDESKNATHN